MIFGFIKNDESKEANEKLNIALEVCSNSRMLTLSINPRPRINGKSPQTLYS